MGRKVLISSTDLKPHWLDTIEHMQSGPQPGEILGGYKVINVFWATDHYIVTLAPKEVESND